MSLAVDAEPANLMFSQRKTQLQVIGRLLQLLSDMRLKWGLDADNLHIVCGLCLSDLADSCSNEFGEARAGVSASTLSDMTGIPRQTVRRRLSALTSQGFASKLDGGMFCVGPLCTEANLAVKIAALAPRA